MGRISENDLRFMRSLKFEECLSALNFSYKLDLTYSPRDKRSKRYLVYLDEFRVREFIVTGEKWFDLSKKIGGGGSIDLVMHLEGLSFRKAISRLKSIMILEN